MARSPSATMRTEGRGMGAKSKVIVVAIAAAGTIGGIIFWRGRGSGLEPTGSGQTAMHRTSRPVPPPLQASRLTLREQPSGASLDLARADDGTWTGAARTNCRIQESRVQPLLDDLAAAAAAPIVAGAPPESAAEQAPPDSLTVVASSGEATLVDLTIVGRTGQGHLVRTADGRTREAFLRRYLFRTELEHWCPTRAEVK